MTSVASRSRPARVSWVASRRPEGIGCFINPFRESINLADPIGEGRLHFGTRAQGPKNEHGGDCLQSELRGNVVVDRREAQHVDLELLSGRQHVLEVPADPVEFIEEAYDLVTGKMQKALSDLDDERSLPIVG